jgi:hypothetical protein
MSQAIDPRLVQQLGGMGNLMEMMKQIGELEQQEGGGGAPSGGKKALGGGGGPQVPGMPPGMDMNAMQAMMAKMMGGGGDAQGGMP